MTGTADTEAYEFQQIYGLNGGHSDQQAGFASGPTTDLPHDAGKYARSSPTSATAMQARPAGAGRYDLDREVEILSKLLDRGKLPHQVLNAKRTPGKPRSSLQAGVPA